MSFDRFLIAALSLAIAPASAQTPAQEWRSIEADNGSVFAIDMKSIRFHNAEYGSTFAIICRVDGKTCPFGNDSQLVFDCRGHYLDANGRGGLMPAPPRSVIGHLAEIACAHVRQPKAAPTPPKAAHKEPKKAPSDPQRFYQTRYFLAGFLIRAAKLCEDDTQPNIDAGFGLLGTKELKMLSKGYPQTTEQWLTAGAEDFNRYAMNNGVETACVKAGEVRRKAEDIAKTDPQ